jgi:hypothetical protein
MDLLLELSGSVPVLDRLLAAIEPNKRALEERVYPTIRRLEAFEQRWQKLLLANLKIILITLISEFNLSLIFISIYFFSIYYLSLIFISIYFFSYFILFLYF